MSKTSRLDRIKANIRKILKGEIKQNPKYTENNVHPCPFCEGVNLEFAYERGSDPYTESIYECPNCEKVMSYTYLSEIEDAYTAMREEDPYSGEIWVDDENYWSTPPKHDWVKIMAEIKREIESEKDAPPPVANDDDEGGYWEDDDDFDDDFDDGDYDEMEDEY